MYVYICVGMVSRHCLILFLGFSSLGMHMRSGEVVTGYDKRCRADSPKDCLSCTLPDTVGKQRTILLGKCFDVGTFGNRTSRFLHLQWCRLSCSNRIRDATSQHSELSFARLSIRARVV
ncbi:hypothetical protein IQ07DRAFT_369351 [Pyrenochaeta sp. DS3sAY3a]|nr:hypothetical protein IQ07DRAFT_369351 [Pyrenochaeta sp. DS3sAY3a]